VARERALQAAAHEVPDAHSAVITARDDPDAVQGDRYRAHRVGVARERAFEPAGREVPDAHRAVLATRDDPGAVRGDCHRRHRAAVALDVRSR
jgi:hypothetical protein